MAPLPTDTPNQVYLAVKPIIGGKLQLPYHFVYQDCINEPRSNFREVPAFAFLISHPIHGNVMFDLGIRKNGEGYPPTLHDRIHVYFKTSCDEDVATILRAGGVNPADIRSLILSHLHWDHIGDPSLFPAADIVLGADAKGPLAKQVYPANPSGSIAELPKDQPVTFIDFSDSSDRTVISPFASFQHAVDYFGDGSLYIVDAPGHMPGHISTLVRVAPETFVFLGGDLCHGRECYDPGTRLICQKTYQDIVTARETVRKLVELNKELANIVVILAHEPERLEEGMPLFPADIKDWVVEEVQKRKDARLQSQL